MKYEEFKKLTKKIAEDLMPGVPYEVSKRGEGASCCWSVTVMSREKVPTHFQIMEHDIDDETIDTTLFAGIRRLAIATGIKDPKIKKLWLIEFIDASTPATQHLGVVFVLAGDHAEAIQIVLGRGINPGGMPRGNEVPAETAARIPKESIGNLLTPVQFDALQKLIEAGGKAA